MIYFGEPWVWWLIYAVAVLAGSLGGLVAELLLRGAAGQLERTRKLEGFYDLGFWANVIVGAVAAVAALAFLDPVSIQTEGVSQEGYSVRTLVGISLIVGSAGGASIAALQERVLSALKLQEAETLAQTAKDEIEGLRTEFAVENVVTTETFDGALRRIDSVRKMYDS